MIAGFIEFFFGNVAACLLACFPLFFFNGHCIRKGLYAIFSGRFAFVYGLSGFPLSCIALVNRGLYFSNPPGRSTVEGSISFCSVSLPLSGVGTRFEALAPQFW